MIPMLAIPFLLASGAWVNFPQRNSADLEIVRYAKALDVATLDSALPHRQLEEWLRLGPPRVEVRQWEISPNCGEKAGNSDGAMPLCVAVSYGRGNVSGIVMIVVGVVNKAPAGLTTLKYAIASPRNQAASEGSELSSETTTALSEFPRILNEVSYSTEHIDIISYARTLDVMDLDASLPSQGLEMWLRSSLLGMTRLNWGVRFDCHSDWSDRYAPSTDAGHTLCVNVFFARTGADGWATIAVGTVDKGRSGPPHLVSVTIRQASKDNGAPKSSDKLSDLPRLLAKLAPETD